MTTKIEVDVLVIGSGAGGAPAAYTLAQAGFSVLVLEKGPRYRREDFLHDEVGLCRRDFFVPWPEDDPHTLLRPNESRATRTNAGWISRCVGGGTVHMSGFFFRFAPKDFALQKYFGPISGTTAIDWPFGYETLAPYYDKVERVVGVSGEVSGNPFEPPRSGPFPYPPVATHPVAEWIDLVGRRLGLHPYPVPRAIITKNEAGRSACVYCQLCGSYGCEVGAKSSTLEALLPAAEATGRCQVFAGAMVQQITMRKDGRAAGAVYLDDRGQSHEVKASTVIVACSAIESARLLLLSASQKHPRGLGNNGGQVGQNLCFSTLGQVTGRLRYADLSDQDAAALRSPMPFVGRAFQDYLELPPSGQVFGKGGMFHLLWEHPNPIHAAEKLLRKENQLVYGAPLMQRLKEHFLDGRTLEAECFSEWLPTPGCHVSLDPEVTDRFGLPAARITLARHPSDYAASAALVSEASRVMNSLGCKELKVSAIGGETFVLQQGTCRMGTDPANSVTTAAGNLHEISNIYVTDGGALPSSGAVPSTMTILANSFRIADGIVAKLRA